MRKLLAMSVLSLTTLLVSGSSATATDDHVKFRRDVEQVVKRVCLQHRMPLNHLRELLAAVQSTFDEPEVGANLAKVSERRREYLLWALADDLLRPMLDDYSLEPQSAKTYRIAVLQSSIRNIGTWPIFPEDPQALRQLAQITSLIETTVKRTHDKASREIGIGNVCRPQKNP